MQTITRGIQRRLEPYTVQLKPIFLRMKDAKLDEAAARFDAVTGAIFTAIWKVARHASESEATAAAWATHDDEMLAYGILVEEDRREAWKRRMPE